MSRFKLKSLRARLGPVSAEMEVIQSERDLLHPLFVVLRDKRALLDASHCRADIEEVAGSIEAVRADLTSALKALGPDSVVAPQIEILRKACREYLDSVITTQHRTLPTDDSGRALTQLRASFRKVAASVGSRYGLASARELADEMDPKNAVHQDRASRYTTDDNHDPFALRPDDRHTLWSQEQLAAFECVTSAETIWIVGRDFWSDIMGPAPFLDAIQFNVHEREITYVYVAFDEPALRHQLTILRQILGLEADDTRLHAIFLTAAEWARLPYIAGNFTIYDPFASHKIPTGFFWYPGGDGESFGQLGSYVTVKWVSAIENICPSIRGRRDGE